MELHSLLLFAAAYLAVLVVPGPAVAALVARVLAGGTGGAPAYIAGFVAGALIWFAVAAAGLTALAAAFAGLFAAIRYAGAAYLLYLAWRLWRAPARPVEAAEIAPEGPGRLFLAGLAINLGNPKSALFFLALLPTVVPVERLTPLDGAALAIVVVVAVSGVLAGYAVAAARARRLFASPLSRRLMNRGSSVVMAGAAAAIATR